MKVAVFMVMLLSGVVGVLSLNYIIGEHSPQSKPIHREKVEYNAIPWQKRVKYYSYSDLSQRPIKAVDCYDLRRTDARVNITAGGIGYTYITLRLKSERSHGLEYAIEIYA